MAASYVPKPYLWADSRCAEAHWLHTRLLPLLLAFAQMWSHGKSEEVPPCRALPQQQHADAFNAHGV